MFPTKHSQKLPEGLIGKTFVATNPVSKSLHLNTVLGGFMLFNSEDLNKASYVF